MNKSGNASKKYEMDMCNGPLFFKMLVFAIPVMLSGILQLLFNAADIIVVGKFAGSEALAAVGSTGSLINLIINVFIGLSVGTNVLVGRFYGAGNHKELHEVVHTSIATALICGLFLILAGFVLAGPALRLMGSPEDVIEKSILYMRIYFCGMPFMMTYNFGAAVLRAVGDTKRPLYYLLIAGVVNVVLNMIFVIVFHMSVAGVAIATVMSQVISSVLVIRCLLKSSGEYRLELRKMKIYSDKLKKMFQIGLPAGLQGALFNISNVLIQSSINSFGSIVMAGNAAGSNLEGFTYTAMNAIYQTSISFTSQNYGAMKFKRIGKIMLNCQLMVFVIGFFMGNLVNLLGDKFLLLYSSDPEVIAVGLQRLATISVFYFLCGMMDVAVGALRGMGYSILPMLVSLSGVCLTRIAWLYTVFQKFHTLKCLYASYPISWGFTFSVHLICFLVVFRKLLKNKSLSSNK